MGENLSPADPGASASRRGRDFLLSGTGILLIAGIMAVANFLASFVSARLDLSAGGVYSVSAGTKRLLRDLQDNLVLKVYFTRKLPSPYGLNEAYLRDLLGEYKAAGRGRVKVEFLDPNRDETVKQEALSAGVAPVRLSVMARDKFELKEAFMGLALLHKGKSEVIPYLENRTEFEYEITRRILKLTRSAMKSAGFVTGHGEKGPNDPAVEAVFGFVREEMNVEPVALDRPIAQSLQALWIISPEKPYKAEELERLKAWVGSGRSLGILLDRRRVDVNTFSARPVDHGLDPLLKAWGLEIRDGFVADLQSERVQLSQQTGMMTMMHIVEYPLLPVATRFHKEHPTTRGLQTVVMPFGHPVSYRGDGKSLSFTSLIESTPYSWYEAGTNISPYNPPQPTQAAEKGPFTLAGALEGDFFSVAPTTASAVEGETYAARGKGRVVVVGNSRFISASFSPKGPNLDAFMNLLEWTLQDEALMSIRSKGASFRPLRPLPDAARRAAKAVLVGFLPLSVLACALAAYRQDKRRRERTAALYGDA